MMITGINILADNSFIERSITGFILGFDDNLSITVKDSSGVTLTGVVLTVDKEGAGVTVHSVDGVYYDYVTVETDYVVTAVVEGYQANTVSFTHDGTSNLSVIITMKTGGEPCISVNPVNKRSFIRFQPCREVFLINEQLGYYDDDEVFHSIKTGCKDCPNEVNDLLPNNLAQENYKFYTPVFVYNEDHSIIIDYPIFGYDQSLTTMKCVVISNTGRILEEVNYDIVEYSERNEKSVRITYTPTAYANGKLRFVFYDTEDGMLAFMSNVFTNSETKEELIDLEYRNSTNRDGFNYEDREDQYNRIFINANYIGGEFEYERKDYKEYTTGERRNQVTGSSKVMRIETELFDPYAHDAMFSLSDHDDIWINGREVVVKTGYRFEESRDFDLQKGVIEFYDQQYSTKNFKG